MKAAPKESLYAQGGWWFLQKQRKQAEGVGGCNSGPLGKRTLLVSQPPAAPLSSPGSPMPSPIPFAPPIPQSSGSCMCLCVCEP